MNTSPICAGWLPVLDARRCHISHPTAHVGAWDAAVRFPTFERLADFEHLARLGVAEKGG